MQCATRSASRNRGSAYVVEAQQAIGGRVAHLEQVALTLFAQVQMSMPLQRFYQRGQKGNETFGADMLGGFPGHQQGLLDLGTIARDTPTLDDPLAIRCLIELSNGILTDIASHGHRRTEQERLWTKEA